MKFQVKALVLGSVLAAAAIALSGCATSSSSSLSGVTIKYLVPSSWANAGAFKVNIAAYEKKYKNTIDVQAVPDANYDSVVQARLAGGSGIDLFAGQDHVANLSKIALQISNAPFEKRMTAVNYDAMKAADGKVYGYPTADGLATNGIFYNKDDFAKAGITAPPTSLGDLTADMAKVKAAGITPLYFAGKDGWTLLQHRNALNPLMALKTPDAYTQLNTNKLTWSKSPFFTEQYDVLTGWVKSGYINTGALTSTYEQSVKAIIDGSASMLFQGSWVISDIRAVSKTAKIGFFPLPTASGHERIQLSRVNIIHIATKSKVAEQAKVFLDFMIQKPQAEAFLAKAPGIPAFTDVTVPSPADPVLIDIEKYTSNGKVGPGFDDVSSLAAPTQDAIIAEYQELIAGRQTTAQFGTALDSIWQDAGKTAGTPGF